MRDLIQSGRLGQIYTVRMYYGNGTAAQVKASPWRDTGAGVLPDLGSHLLDTLSFWLGPIAAPFKVISASRFENLSFDHVTFGAAGTPLLQLETSLLSWRNHFYADVHAEKGSAHITLAVQMGAEHLHQPRPGAAVRAARRGIGDLGAGRSDLGARIPAFQVALRRRRQFVAERSVDQPHAEFAQRCRAVG